MSLSARGPVTWPVPVPWLTLTARGPCGCSWRRRRRHRPVNHPLRSAGWRRCPPLPPSVDLRPRPSSFRRRASPHRWGQAGGARLCARARAPAQRPPARQAPPRRPPRHARALVLRFRVLSSPWLSPNHLTALRGTLPHFPVLHCHPRPLSLRPALRGLPDSRSRGFWGLLPKACLTWRRSWALREW